MDQEPKPKSLYEDLPLRPVSLSEVHDWIVSNRSIAEVEGDPRCPIVTRSDEADRSEDIAAIQKHLIQVLDTLVEFDQHFHELFDCR